MQFIGTIVAGTVNLGVAWWMLGSVKDICQTDLLAANSPWTCPGDHVFFDASVIWGLVGPKRIFGKLGVYPQLNWFFLGGAAAPVLVWLAHKAFPNVKWIPLINMPVMLGSTAMMPPATAVPGSPLGPSSTILSLNITRLGGTATIMCSLQAWMLVWPLWLYCYTLPWVPTHL